MRDQNSKAIGLMIGAMLCFAALDTTIKLAASTLSPPQVMFFLLAGGAIIFTIMAQLQGTLAFTKQALSPLLLIRYAAEIGATFGMIQALASLPLSTIGAMVQTVPLLVTLGAVLFLNERVSWRRWSAIIVGFIGVLLIIQPGTQGFEPSILWAVLGTLGLAARDLTTRKTPVQISTACLAAYTMYAAVPFAFMWVVLTGHSFLISDANVWLMIATMCAFGPVGYLMLIASGRIADVSIIAPYRYSRLLFMLIFGIIIFSERPNMLVMAGALLVVASGIYIMWRERMLAKTEHESALE